MLQDNKLSTACRPACAFPCRFHLVSYDFRMTIVAIMMSGSYLTVAYGSHVSWQLLGVTFAAFQGGLGEASCLALCSFYDSRRALTLWSSGTGFAGRCVRMCFCIATHVAWQNDTAELRMCWEQHKCLWAAQAGIASKYAQSAPSQVECED